MTGTVPPATVARPGLDAPSLPHLLLARADAMRDRVAFRYKRLGYWHEITWGDYAARAAAAGLGFRALGLKAGDVVGILSGNRPEWLEADLGLQGIGVITAALHPASPPAEVARMLEHVDAAALLVEDEEQLEVARSIRDQVPSLRRIVVVDTHGMPVLEGDAELSFDELCANGAATTSDPLGTWRALLDTITSDGPATVVLSAGSDPPRAVVLSQSNLVSTASMLVSALGMRADDEVLSAALPLAYVVERVVSGAAAVRAGYVVNFGAGPYTVTEDAREVQPTIFVAVPRWWEQTRDVIELRMAAADPLKRRVYRYWRRRGAARIGRRPSRLGRVMLYRPLWRKFGLARCRIVLSVGAPIGDQVVEFFASLALPVRDSYGTVETTGFATCTPANELRIGTAGKALPGSEVRIAADDEILVRGPNVFLGYARDPDHTKEVLDPDGWLHTGDTGRLDPDGYLTVTGRKKDLVVTTGGTPVEPRFLEDRLKRSPFVREAVLVGNARPYLVVLIGLAEDNVGAWASEHSVPYTTFRDLSEKPEVGQLIGDWVDSVNKDLGPAEQIRAFRVLPTQLDEASGALTSTRRVRREVVIERYAALVEDMYR
jgi:long-chain acyl-CoA synthetase